MQGPPIPLLDIEEYAQHLVINTNRRYDSLDDATTAKDHDMKLASWNIQGAQGSVSLQRWANTLHLISQCRIDLCGIQEYHPGFPKPEAATTALNNDYKCYAAPGTEPQIASMVSGLMRCMSPMIHVDNCPFLHIGLRPQNRALDRRK